MMKVDRMAKRRESILYLIPSPPEDAALVGVAEVGACEKLCIRSGFGDRLS